MASDVVQDRGAWASYKTALDELARRSETLAGVLDEKSEAAAKAELAFQVALAAYHQARDRLRDSERA